MLSLLPFKGRVGMGFSKRGRDTGRGEWLPGLTASP
jgi:hypothetical protein